MWQKLSKWWRGQPATSPPPQANRQLNCYSLFCSFTTTSAEELARHEATQHGPADPDL